MRKGLATLTFAALATLMLLAATAAASTPATQATTAAAPGHAAASGTAMTSASGPAGGAQPQDPPHVMVIVEENRNRSKVVGASNMPYFNSLASKYGNTTDWNGVSHPSLPNYLALISGSTQGVSEDGCSDSFSGIATIGSQLSALGIPWKAYMEELPEPGSEVCAVGGYDKAHNPFAYFPETNGPNVVPATQFRTDESSGQLPAFIFYVPNLANDGHAGTNEQVDNYLKSLIPQLLGSSWYRAGGVVIITWDESEGEELIPTVVLTGQGSGQVLTTPGNHYGTLATIENLYGLPLLGRAAGAPTLAPLLAPHWYVNGVRLSGGAAGGSDMLVWGSLTLENPKLGGLTCQTLAGGNFSNPVGGGAGTGAFDALTFYDCVAPTCEAAKGRLRVLPEKQSWSAALSEEAGVFREKIEGIALRAICVGTASNVEFHGALKPSLEAVSGMIGLPGRLVFDAGSGALESSEGAGAVSAKLKLMGFEAGEIIRAKKP